MSNEETKKIQLNAEKVLKILKGKTVSEAKEILYAAVRISQKRAIL